ncbi:BRO family protein [Bacteroides graminisolvens]|uniref:BRO family protein n=1 Tax=Bacteroides graminisolvens TaxID=477666 RepID=UPI00240A3DEC|nr:BRO family protein [Bacteroides graminisolvens]
MNQLTKLFEGEEIRIIEQNGKHLFVATDVARVLGHTNPQRAIRDHCKGVTETVIPTNGGLQSIKLIGEGDIYRLVVRSKLKSAERFESWVFDEVLPSIRKDGGYIVATVEQSPEEIMARALIVANSTIARIESEKERIAAEKEALLHSGKLYTSTEIAKELGLRSANELNKLLEREKIQYKVNGTWVLSARDAERNFTSIKQMVLDSGRTVYDRKWTGIGRDFLINTFGERLKK